MYSLDKFKFAFNDAFPQWLYDIIMSEMFENFLWFSFLVYFLGGIVIFGELFEYITENKIVISICFWMIAFSMWGMREYFNTDSLCNIPIFAILPTGLFHIYLYILASEYYYKFVRNK